MIQEVKKVESRSGIKDQQHRLEISRVVTGSLFAQGIVKHVYACMLLQDTSSPPRSMPRPSNLVTIRGPSPVGGTRLSKLMRRLASRTAAGVLLVAGVRFQDEPYCACAGLGVMFKNSAKFKLFGVVAMNPPYVCPLPPGVDIIDDGRGVVFDGGVEGACIGCLKEPTRTGVGDVARYMRRVVSSSPCFSSRAAPAAVKPL